MPGADGSLAPGLLLAAPRLGDPNFVRSVVLLGHHDEEGALGWVLNGEALAPVHRVLRDAGLVPEGFALPEGGAYATSVRLGGPVTPGSAWLLYRKADGIEPLSGDLSVGEDHAVTCARESIEALASGRGPSWFRLLLGYAGWAPGQLESEIAAGAWLPARLDPSLLLDREPDELWDAAYRAAGTNAFSFTGGNGGSA
jgi:putative transcriptional regulator